MAAAQSPSWQIIAARKQKDIYDAIPSAWIVDKSLLVGHNSTGLPKKCPHIMSKEELFITESRAVDILSRIRARKWTSHQVTLAFCKRAALAHQATNCLALVMFDSALEEAKKLDAYMKKHGKPIGPLHGLPISVKEHIYLANTPATSGLISWADAPSPHDALICKIFRQAGAVFHVKTTNPQTLMALETHSNLFGRTSNPFNTSLTSGGSSGGESALVAMRGSPLGIGTDIGGSIRGPSGFCGGWGLKASVARIPHSGLSGLHAGMENIIGCVGPMANSLADLRLFCSVALAKEPWDEEPSLIDIPWRNTTAADLPKRLRIGVMFNDGAVLPHPPITRALRHTVDKLRAAGHEIVEWNPQHHASLLSWINKAYFLDGGDEYKSTLLQESDPPVPIIQWLLDSEATTRHTIEETWALNSTRDKLRTAFSLQWKEAGVDALLCPVNASCASAHDESKYWGYTAVFNATDLPGVVFPVTEVRETDTWEEGAVPVQGEKDAMYRKFWDEGGAGKYKDAPVNLQLVGKRLREERLLAVAEVVEGCLKEDKQSVQKVRNPVQKEEMVQSRL
ncbi:amidase [Aureobasidium pullulans]|uniref:amidase n=1 Tax=Aureobasidium pullulans TaxID=5580 RepID=A0A4S9XAU1_AURPU|nr:amidase [Aureobasidium pullulans]